MTAHRCAFCRQLLGVEPCIYCLRYTCARCHHGARHLNACPDTAKRET